MMTRRFRYLGCVAVAAALGVCLAAASVEDDRKKIDASEKKAIEALVSAHPDAKAEFDDAYGYAVMDVSVQWGTATYMDRQGGGLGVAVDNKTHSRTYMECTANPDREVSQAYIVFLFDDEAAFKSFIDGWKAGASKKKAETRAGLQASSGFVGGIKVYELDQGQLLNEAEIWNTWYHPNKHLNQK
jgi:hypothetical protein